MEIPDPDAAHAYAEQVRILHAEVTYCCRGLADARPLSSAAWSGPARAAFDEVYGECVANAASLVRSLGEMHLDAVAFADRIASARDDLAQAHLAGGIVDVLTVADLAQAGVDLVSDAGTIALSGVGRALVHGVGDLLVSALRDALIAVASRRAVYAGFRSVLRFVAPRVVGALAVDEGLRLALGESLDPRDDAGALAMSVVLPGRKASFDELVARLLPRGFDLTAHEGDVGHTLSKHVVGAIEDLEARLIRDRRSYRSYGFVGQDAAETAVRKTFADNLDAIEKWFASGAEKGEFETLLPPGLVVGGYAKSRTGVISRADPARLVLVRLFLVHSGDEIVIRTAFPTVITTARGAS